MSYSDLNIYLPIFLGTSEDVLERGAGHLFGTSLPIGEEGRSVLTSHSGLLRAPLFNNLEKAKIGQLFSINTLGEERVYKVVEIEMVLPEDVEKLAAVEGKELVTLLTCTPTGENTHRLLVTGELTNDEVGESFFWLFPIVTLSLVFLGFLLFLIVRKNRSILPPRESQINSGLAEAENRGKS